MGWLGIALGMLACWLLYRTPVAFWLAIIATLGIFWTYGIMHNYATESAKRRSNYTGGFWDLSDKDIDSVPSWLAGMNLILTIVLFMLCVYGGYMVLKG